MATQPKSSDAANAALSAIEEALNLGPAEPASEAAKTVGKPGDSDKTLKLPAIPADELGSLGGAKGAEAKAPELKMPEPKSADAKAAEAKAAEQKTVEPRPEARPAAVWRERSPTGCRSKRWAGSVPQLHACCARWRSRE